MGILSPVVAPFVENGGRRLPDRSVTSGAERPNGERAVYAEDEGKPVCGTGQVG